MINYLLLPFHAAASSDLTECVLDVIRMHDLTALI